MKPHNGDSLSVIHSALSELAAIVGHGTAEDLFFTLGTVPTNDFGGLGADDWAAPASVNELW